MSFLDSISQTAKAGSQQQDGALNKLFSDFTHSINEFQKKSVLLGTKRDSQIVRYAIETELIPQCETLRDEIERSLKNAESNGKLVSDFAGLKDELIMSKRRFYEGKAKFPMKTKPARAHSSSQNSGYVSMPLTGNTENTPLLKASNEQLQQEQQLQTQSQQTQEQISGVSQDELNFHTLIQEERSEELGRIHSAVQEVNAIFHQLGSLVREQGEDVDNIDNNISGLAGNLQRANEQLGKAEQSQRKRNRCGIVALIIIVVVVLVVVLAALG
ncbi:LANO_0H13586g1_1 [Lachancea nothofagi CBS 11611]|uniref:LANO_0H13586g1_1 n=1 Tax=Lachancea nothofagi CBS 11611 TaxID=1266666 RepID=A0A1G4KMJ6_9SACH|nr:LANO_0H13586g1_1 [Lachancea nothofagi CBS 11611]